MKAMQKGIETSRPPIFNSKDPIFVSSQFTRQKVRVIGRDIVHKFKFNTIVKQDEASKIFTHRRDDRLRKLNAEDDKKPTEGRLAIMSNRELFVEKQNYDEFSKANAKHERKLVQRNFDIKRID